MYLCTFYIIFTYEYISCISYKLRNMPPATYVRIYIYLIDNDSITLAMNLSSKPLINNPSPIPNCNHEQRTPIVKFNTCLSVLWNVFQS